MQLPRTRKPAPAIPTAAMADIAFLLIIFYALTASFEVDKTRVLLPQTAVRRDLPHGAAWVALAADGAIRVSDGRAPSAPVGGLEELRALAVRLLARDPQRAFVLKADRRTPFRTIDGALDALNQARVEQLYLLSEPRRTSGG
jgi:biopolymer transport protein ExbD